VAGDVHWPAYGELTRAGSYCRTSGLGVVAYSTKTPKPLRQSAADVFGSQMPAEPRTPPEGYRGAIPAPTPRSGRSAPAEQRHSTNDSPNASQREHHWGPRRWSSRCTSWRVSRRRVSSPLWWIANRTRGRTWAPTSRARPMMVRSTAMKPQARDVRPSTWCLGEHDIGKPILRRVFRVKRLMLFGPNWE